MPPDLILRPEAAPDREAVEALYAVAFGPGRFARTGFRLRGQAPFHTASAFVAERNGYVIGAIRQTCATIGGAPVFLLGPLAVAETAAKQGIGRRLLALSLQAADSTSVEAVVLIGEPAFYGPAGFAQVPPNRIVVAGPVEPRRLLVRPANSAVSGVLTVGDWPARDR